MLDLAANDPLIKTYLHDLQRLKSQSVTHELGLRGPFQTLLDKAAKKRGCATQHRNPHRGIVQRRGSSPEARNGR